MMRHLGSHLQDETVVAQELLLEANNPDLQRSELDSAIDLLLRMQKLILKKDLHPCVCSQHLRVAFQSNLSNAFRFTIDRQ